MKEILKEYYDIDIKDYREDKEGLIFQVGGINYFLVKTFYDETYLNELFKICNEVRKQKVRLHDFIRNKNNQLLSNGYVLFKINGLIDNIDLSDIEIFNSIDCNKYLNEYITMEDFWQNKIDYYEKQVSELSDNKLINHSFDYFIGIAEIIILYLKKHPTKKELCLSHKTLDTLRTIDYYNPLNITFDLKLKDMASYIRMTNNYDLLNDLLDKIDIVDKSYLFTRMIFPFKYFQIIGDMVVDKEEEKELVDILNKIKEYETYVDRIQKMFGIYLFSWIKKE